MEKAGPEKQPSKPEDGEKKEAARSTSSDGRPRGLRLSAIVAVAVAVLLIVWLLAKGGGDSSSTTRTEETAPTAKTVKVVPQSELLQALKGVGYPVYWAGPRLGVEYEVQRLTGRTYVRYLPKGEEAETEKSFLTVGSYEEAEALASIRNLGQEPGAILVKIAGGGSAYAESPQATSAYMAFPGVDVQIEVYDPEAGEALSLIRSGAIVPVG